MRKCFCTALTALLLIGGCDSTDSREQIRIKPPLKARRSEQPADSHITPTPTPPYNPRLTARTRSGQLHRAIAPRGARLSRRWTTIVIHHSATDRGSASVFDKNHREQNGWDELGYHFVIGNGHGSGDGQIEIGPRWHKQKHGAHCKTPDNYFNDHGIGICLVGDFTGDRPTPRQLSSLVALIRALSDMTGIPADRVTSHGQVNPKTACPGRFMPVADIRRAIATPASAATFP